MNQVKVYSVILLSVIVLSLLHSWDGQANPVSCRGDITADIAQFMQSRSEALVCVLGSKQKLPEFPKKKSSFKGRSNVDFWGRSFSESGSVRVFKSDGPQSITDCSSGTGGCNEFPDTQNNCGKGLFILRWRTDNPDVSIASSTEFGGTVPSPQKLGKKGYIIGSNCHRPLFGFGKVERGNESNLVDVTYEVRFWKSGL